MSSSRDFTHAETGDHGRIIHNEWWQWCTLANMSVTETAKGNAERMEETHEETKC